MLRERTEARRPPADGSRRFGRATSGHRLVRAFDGFESFPALRQARDAALEVAGHDPAALVAALESEPALTVAVLRAAAGRATRPDTVSSVPHALAIVPPREVTAILERTPVFDFFDRSRRWSAVAERFRVHARATQAAAERIRRGLGMPPRADLAAAALLHDIGKLVLAEAYDGYEEILELRATPAERLRLERSELGIDHGAAGGVLARRMRLSKRLSRIVEHHHDEIRAGTSDDAAIVALADMLVHYAAGAPVSPKAIGRLSALVGLPRDKLREMLYELPEQAGPVRAGMPSILTPKETRCLQLLGEGKSYAEIASALGISSSTVRSHLHNSYAKLGVPDRAQAVLLAVKRGWL